MSKYTEWLWLVLFGSVYMVSTAYWEAAIVKIVWWWVTQFVALPPTTGNLIVALVFTLVIIPHFVWFPVTLFKELRWLLHYESRPRLIAV